MFNCSAVNETQFEEMVFAIVNLKGAGQKQAYPKLILMSNCLSLLMLPIFLVVWQPQPLLPLR